MLAYFFAFRYIIKLYKCQKRQFCLGSITKCHVIRTGGGFQGGAKNAPKAICNLSCKLPILRFGACMVFRFFGSWGRLQTTPSGLQGWMEYATPALQVVIVPYLLGSTRELGAV